MLLFDKFSMLKLSMFVSSSVKLCNMFDDKSKVLRFDKFFKGVRLFCRVNHITGNIQKIQARKMLYKTKDILPIVITSVSQYVT